MINSIIAPAGGFGNHIRWLVLLDPRFKVLYSIVDEGLYETFKGADWPSYNDYVTFEYINIPDAILTEIKEKTSPFDINFDTVSEKVDFILNYVYPPHRSYRNWLKFEGTYRRFFDQLISFDHTITNKNVDKVILVSIDPELAFKNFFKFHPLMPRSKKEFIELIIRDTEENLAYIQNHNISYINIDSSVLLAEELNYEFYKKIIEFFNLTDNYTHAAKIHAVWYQLHKNAEQDLVRDVLNLYK